MGNEPLEPAAVGDAGVAAGAAVVAAGVTAAVAVVAGAAVVTAGVTAVVAAVTAWSRLILEITRPIWLIFAVFLALWGLDYPLAVSS